MKNIITQEQAKKIFSQQKHRLDSGIKAGIAASPYVNALEKGTFPAAVAAQLTSVIQGRSAPGDSKVFPTFENQGSVCTGSGPRDGNGTNQYSYNPKIKVSEGTPIKIGTLQDFSSSLKSQFQATKQIVTEYINADIRAELFSRSGVKAVVRSGVSATAMIAGGYNQIDTAFPAIESDARLTPILLLKFARFMLENLKVKQFGSGANTNLRFVGGFELRESLGECLGIEFHLDQEPMRYNMSSSGPVFVEPEIVVDDPIKGKVGVPNPDWDEAYGEVGFLIGEGSFEFQVPKSGKYTKGYGKNGVKTEFNVAKRYGVITTSIAKSLRPIYPWFVMPILYKR